MSFSLPLSRAAAELKRSMMRQLIATTARPGILSFAGGMPAPELLPVEAWRQACDRVLATDGPRALQYGPPFPPLQDHIAELMRLRGVQVAPEEVFITSGCQQGLQIAATMLMDPESVAVMDEFVFPGVKQAFGAGGRTLRPVVARAGQPLDLGALEAALSASPSPRALVVVPEFHNPLGRSLGEAERLALAELAARHGVAIVEDDPYWALRFEGTSPHALAAFAPDRTIYLGSFSKMVAPALRLGWLVAPGGQGDRLRVIKESLDLESSAFIQRAAAAFIESGALEAHLARSKAAYPERRDAMLAAIRTHLPAGTRFSQPEGGMFIWAELPDALGIDTLGLLDDAVAAGVAYIPGAAFAVGEAADWDGRRAMRLNFTNAGAADIGRGMQTLGSIISSFREGRQSP